MLVQGERHPFVMETVKADDNAKLGMQSYLGVKSTSKQD